MIYSGWLVHPTLALCRCSDSSRRESPALKSYSIRLNADAKSKYILLQSFPHVCLNVRLPNHAVSLEQQNRRFLTIIGRPTSTATSLPDPKQHDIKVVEDLSQMKRLKCEAGHGTSKETDHILTNMARAVIHQQDSIFGNKLIDTLQVAKTGKVRHVEILTQNFRVDI
jgi:hypothetical protein